MYVVPLDITKPLVGFDIFRIVWVDITASVVSVLAGCGGLRSLIVDSITFRAKSTVFLL